MDDSHNEEIPKKVRRTAPVKIRRIIALLLEKAARLAGGCPGFVALVELPYLRPKCLQGDPPPWTWQILS